MEGFLQVISLIVAAIVITITIVANANYKKDECQCDYKECSTCPFPCEHRDHNRGE